MKASHDNQWGSPSEYISKGNKNSKETPRRTSYEAKDSNNSHVYQGMK